MQKLKESGLRYSYSNTKTTSIGDLSRNAIDVYVYRRKYTVGLGIFNVKVKRFSNEVKVPQIGWNTITNLKSSLFKGIDENAFMYLVHSYYAEIVMKQLQPQIMVSIMHLHCKRIIFMVCNFTQKRVVKQVSNY